MTPTNSEKSKFKPRTPDAVSSFIRKTYELLDDQRFPDIVDWNSEGTALVIKKPTEFGQKVLPAYFKHNNLTSFVRQLNMYDFHKRRTQKYDHVYYHDLFQRGKKHLLKEIKRKNQDNTLANIQKAIETLETVQGGSKPESSTNIYENQLLKKLNKDALSRIASLENKVKDLTIQNQALWNQVSHQNQKEDVLVSFLANFMKKKGITLDQLPKVLNNQFNLPPLNMGSDLKASTKDLGSYSHDSQQLSSRKMSTPMNVGDFLNFGDDSSNSTEISPTSPLSKGNFENGRRMENNEIMSSSADPLTDSIYQTQTEEPSEVTTLSPNLDWLTQQKASFDNWNLESQYMKSLSGLDDKAKDSNFGVRNNQIELLGKRGSAEDKEEPKELAKLIKKDSYLGLNPFSRNELTSNKEEYGDMRIKKFDSFADMFPNMDGLPNQGLDLMDFN